MLLLFQFLFSIINCHEYIFENGIPKKIQDQVELENPIIPNRLLSPKFNESIGHMLMNPIDEGKNGLVSKQQDLMEYFSDLTPDEMETLGLRELIRLCPDANNTDLPLLFPRFLCGLSAVYRKNGRKSLKYTELIFPRLTDAIRSLNDVENYPCHKLNRTDVVALLPGRIYSGCVDDTDPLSYSQFTSAFVMTHPFPDALKSCSPPHPVCELRSMIFQHRVLYQEEECCCEGQACALLIFSQTTSLIPLVIKTIDLSREKMVRVPETTTPDDHLSHRDGPSGDGDGDQSTAPPIGGIFLSGRR
ncbi:unnamed protein product [Caenorhabditis brenneri]